MMLAAGDPFEGLGKAMESMLGGGGGGLGWASQILLIFYFYLLVRWQHVRRPMMYLLGAAGLVFSMVGAFFTLGSSTYVVATIFGIIGNLVAFVGAVGACYGAQLPMKLPGNLDATGTPPPPPAK